MNTAHSSLEEEQPKKRNNTANLQLEIGPKYGVLFNIPHSHTTILIQFWMMPKQKEELLPFPFAVLPSYLPHFGAAHAWIIEFGP